MTKSPQRIVASLMLAAGLGLLPGTVRAQGGALLPDSGLVGTLTTTAPLAFFTFSGSAGAQVDLAVMGLTQPLLPVASLSSPTQQQLASSMADARNPDLQRIALQLPQDGVYTVLVSGGGGVGDFVIHLSVTVPAPVCGDGALGAGEACDDGGTSSGDGCSAACAVESGFGCGGEPSTCSPIPGALIPVAATADLVSLSPQAPLSFVFFDGEAGERADIVVTALAQGLSPTASLLSPTQQQVAIASADPGDPGLQRISILLPASGLYTVLVSSGGATSDLAILSTILRHCGDGVVAPFETCDDGGGAAGDGCDASCGIEPNHICSDEPSVCGPLLGGGLKLAWGRSTVPPGFGLLDTESFGGGLSALGDVDGDGIPDAVAGVPRDLAGGIAAGGAWNLFLRDDGSVRQIERLDATSGILGASLEDGDRFGASAAWIGDLDGDGIRELAVGAPTDADPVTKLAATGSIRVLFLASDGSLRSATEIGSSVGGLPGLSKASDFGSAVEGIGDRNGDGVPDLAVGAPGAGSNDQGSVWLLFLASDGSLQEARLLSLFPAAGDLAGSALARVGDLDGDGHEDLAVGLPRANDGGLDRGAIEIVFLDADANVTGTARISDTQGGLVAPLSDGDRFGSALEPLGDFDGDGRFDLAVGIPRAADGGTRRGQVRILSLAPDGTVARELSIEPSSWLFGEGTSDGDELGLALAAVGDLGGDGVTELLVGAPFDDEGGTGAGDLGAVWVLELAGDGSQVLCGNGFLDPLEDCDDGTAQGAGTCPAGCTSVPEPGVTAMLLAGLLGLSALGRRR